MTQLEAAVDLEAHIGTTNKRLKAIEHRLTRPPAQPAFERLATSMTPGASGFAVAFFPGPEQGQFWYMRRLWVGGLARTTTAAGSIDLFASTFDLRGATSLAAFGAQDQIDFATSLPNTAYWSRGQVRLQYGEQFFVTLTGGTNAQQYVVTCSVEIIEEAAARQEFDL